MLVPARYWLFTRVLHVFWLGHAEPVAKGIAEHSFNAVELVIGRRKKLHAPGFHFFIGLAAVGGLEHARAECSLFHQSADGLNVLRLDLLHLGAVKRLRSYLHEDDREIGLPFGA